MAQNKTTYDFFQDANIYEQFVIDLLAIRKFMPGREIVERLVKELQIKNENARKILQRAAGKGLIGTSKPLTFGNGQYIYTVVGAGLERANIKSVTKKFRPPLYRLLDALDDNEGIISYYEALKVSASPEEKISSKVNVLDELIYILVKLEIITVENDDYSVRYLVEKTIVDVPTAMTQHYSKMLLDCLFIPDILRWLKRVNIIDNLKSVYRSKTSPSLGALHNGLVWDAYAYTKTTGVNSIVGKKATTIEKQTLVVIDIVINREYGQSDLDGFLCRVQINLNSVKTGIRKMMPIVVYKKVSEEVLNKLSVLGFMSFDLGSIYGKNIYAIVDNLNVIQKEGDNGIYNTEQRIMKSLAAIRTSGQEDNLANLRGILFEYLIYPILHYIFPNAAIYHGKYLSKKNEEGNKEGYEYDFIVQSSNPKEIVIVEVKGYSSMTKIPIGTIRTKNTLSWFFGKTLPFAKEKYKKELETGYEFKACYITSAGFYEDGMTYMNGMKKLKSKKMMSYYDGTTLLQLLNDNDFNNIRKTIEKYYIKKEE